ncbi:MAG TPA: hypothetical protein VER03_08015 [Bryobacteraceae bacterium]|nr:hypothetical protein [Bryobacteraceae bacterium]
MTTPAMRARSLSERPEMCGVMMALSNFESAWPAGSGSGSVTSTPAPASFLGVERGDNDDIDKREHIVELIGFDVAAHDGPKGKSSGSTPITFMPWAQAWTFDAGAVCLHLAQFPGGGKTFFADALRGDQRVGVGDFFGEGVARSG